MDGSSSPERRYLGPFSSDDRPANGHAASKGLYGPTQYGSKAVGAPKPLKGAAAASILRLLVDHQRQQVLQTAQSAAQGGGASDGLLVSSATPLLPGMPVCACV